jgi:NAD(P)-dependent dehydrogenase (short-subunit alcohol dehydrogenase family)
MPVQLEKDSVVVVTGGTAGVGRAVAREFARAGARVAVLARDSARLEATRDELLRCGVAALALQADVADADAVEAAAARIEQELGPIAVWVNNAMVTVVAPFADLEPAEFRRVTEVTYLGTVWGSLAALKRMRPRNRGTIVQVGSALAYRSIPLQSAYCGAKHAVRGFTESLRTELLHEGSQVRVTIVELPAVNTPQFDWCRTKLGRRPRPLGKVYQPEVMAHAIVGAAQSGRRELYPTWSSTIAIWGDKVAPGLLDRYLADAAWEGQQSGEPVAAGRVDNLFAPAPLPAAARGRFDANARARSTSLWANMHRGALLLGALGLLAIGWGATGRRGARAAGR